MACTNLASFLLAQALDRKKEIALRLAIGATRRNLIGQLLHAALDLCLAQQDFEMIFRLHELTGQLALHTLHVPIHLL